MLRSCILLVHALLLAFLIGSVHAQAPDKSCCAAYYGSDSAPDTCAHCNLQNFECRPSHQQAGVSNTSQDCISFTYADETACKAACSDCTWLDSSSFNGYGCPATTTSPESSCCAATYGVSLDENANACDQSYCADKGNGFTCRDSHQHAGVDKTSKDCVSFEYATDKACTDIGATWISPGWNGFSVGCAFNDAQFVAAAKSHAHSGPNGKGAATLAIVSALTALALALT